RGEQLADRLRCKQARRAAAEENAVHFAAGDLRRLCPGIAGQPLQVRGGREAPVQRVGVEIAVRALAHAPGKVHVKRQRRSQETGHDATITPETLSYEIVSAFSPEVRMTSVTETGQVTCINKTDRCDSHE